MTTSFRVPQTAEEADPRRWLGFAFLLLASFMNLMDVTIVNVALPSMQQNLSASPSEIEWVVAAYVLAFALGLLPFGRLGDIVGRKRMFLIGVTLFTLGSFLCGVAPSIQLLIGARALQGLAASAMTPQVLAIAQVSFPPREKGLMFSLFGLSASLASVCGPIIGGALIAGNFFGLDWRPIFLVNIPFGILAVVAGAAVVTKVPPHPGLKNDYLGIGLFGLAMVLLVYPLIEGHTYGWPLWVFGMIGVSVLLMAAFYFWERRRHAENATQLLPLELLHNRNFLARHADHHHLFLGHSRHLHRHRHLPADRLRHDAAAVGPDHRAVLARRHGSLDHFRALRQPLAAAAGRHRGAAAGGGHDLSASPVRPRHRQR